MTLCIEKLLTLKSIILDGRRMVGQTAWVVFGIEEKLDANISQVIDIPTGKREIWFYYQHVTTAPNGQTTATRKKRCCKLSLILYIERNVLGMWKELWIELDAPGVFS